jgi:hypothetical protein
MCFQLFFLNNLNENDKNALHNLAVLCEKCHNDTHHKNLKIHKYVDTSVGVKLDLLKLTNCSTESNNINANTLLN